MKMRLSNRRTLTMIALAVGIMTFKPTPVLASSSEEATEDQGVETAEVATEEVASEVVEVETPGTAEPFESNGSMYQFDSIGIAIAPPMGWKVIQHAGTGPSLVFEEPKEVVPTNIKNPVTTYQRNVTLSVKHEATPIDEMTAKELVENLKERFSGQAIVSNYDVTEYKIIDMAEGQKALLVYAGFTLGQTQMMHMHILMSDTNKQYLQTYTDMGDRFSPDDEGFTQAWNSMVSLVVNGAAPIRYEDAVKYGGAAAGVLVLMIILGVLRRRRIKRSYSDEALSTDESSSISSAISSEPVWNDGDDFLGETTPTEATTGWVLP